eukprot:15444566-Alexandrium_andersonii.AAC.1
MQGSVQDIRVDSVQGDATYDWGSVLGSLQADIRVGSVRCIAPMLDCLFQLAALLPLWAPIVAAACFACRGLREEEMEDEEGGGGEDDEGSEEEDGVPLEALPQARPRARACL